MGRPPSRNPTDHEFEILKIAWQHGRVTVRQVCDELAGTRKRARTSIITIMNVMARKGYLERSIVDGTHFYSPLVTKAGTKRKIIRDLVRRVFGGSSVSLVLNLLKREQLDADELAQLKALIEKKSKD